MLRCAHIVLCLHMYTDGPQCLQCAHLVKQAGIYFRNAVKPEGFKSCVDVLQPPRKGSAWHGPTLSTSSGHAASTSCHVARALGQCGRGMQDDKALQFNEWGDQGCVVMLHDLKQHGSDLVQQTKDLVSKLGDVKFVFPTAPSVRLCCFP